jgi:hypothetical protein
VYEKATFGHCFLDVMFEHNGWDVVIPWRVQANFQLKIISGKHRMDCSTFGNLYDDAEHSGRIYVECKPSISDDYPSVMRQVLKYSGDGGIKVVVARSISSMSVPLESIRQIFRRSGIHLILESEYDHPQG